MIIHNPILTGSFTYNGADISSLLSSSANITSLNAATASLNTFSASVLTFTGSVNTFTGSANSRLSSLEAATASLYSATSSFSGRVGALESYTASQNIRNTTYATTGSNTLVGTQYISNTNDAIGFSATTSSIYTDGGLQVTKNAYFSSSMFVKGNLTVYGTQSVSFITSSQLNISTNLITVNTSTPSVRFGGLAVYDSGSTGLTGSILWDSQNNHWIYTNPSGSSYSGGMLISGPRNTGSIGDEQGTTLNAIMKGMGGDHITSSGMFESGSNVGIGITNPDTKLQVVGSFGQQIRFGTNTSVYTNISMGSGFTTFDSIGGDSGAYSFRDDGTTRMFIDSSGNVGIGTTSPSGLLHLSNSNPQLFITNTQGGSSYYMTVSPSIGFNIYESGVASWFTIKNGGNVGIGTTNPSYPLHISAFDGSFALTGTRGTGTTHLWYTSGVNNQNLIYNNPNGDHYFYSNSTPVLSITTNKYVGIGLNGPTNLLHVQKDLPSEAIVNFVNSSSTGFGLNINAGGGTRYALSVNDYNGNALARFLANSITLLGTATSNASMGQTGALQVAGGVRATSGLLTSIEVGTIAQNATTTVNIDYSGLYLITNGGNNSALIMFTRAGGSRGAQLISSTNSNNDIVVGTTSEPSGGNYLRIWSSAVGVFSIKNVNAYTGPYSITAISTQ